MLLSDELGIHIPIDKHFKRRDLYLVYVNYINYLNYVLVLSFL